MTLISPIISPALVPSNLPHAEPSNSSLLAKEPLLNAATQARSGSISPYAAEVLAVPLAPAGRFPNEGDLFSMLFDLDGNNAISLDDFAQPSEAEAKELMKLYEGSGLGGDDLDLMEHRA